MHPRFRVLSALLFTVLVFTLATTMAVAGASLKLPKDMVSVLPGNIHALVVVPSVDDLDEAVKPFEYLLDLPEGESFDIKDILAMGLGENGALIDPDKPIALAVTIGNVMMGEAVNMALAVSLDMDKASGDEMIASGMDMGAGMVPRLRQGNYFVFSTDPLFAPGDGSSSLLKNIPEGSIVACLDLEKVFADFRPLIEMGLGMAAMSMGGPTEDGKAPPVSAGEMTALTNMIVALMDSGQRYNLVFGIVDDKVLLATQLDIIPGSPLAPIDQPDFKDALELTRLLPENPAFVLAQAWNFGPLMDYYAEYYTASIAKLAAVMSPEDNAAFVNWFDSFSQKLDMYELPMAIGVNLSQDGLAMNGVLKCDDSAQRMADMTAMIEGVPSDLGFSFKALPAAKVAGINVKAWSIVYDSSTMIESMTESMGTPMDEEAKEQLAMTDSIVNKFMSRMMLASSGDYLFYGTGPDTKGIQDMLKFSKKKHGVDKFTAKAAKAAGKDCRFVETVDVMSALVWGLELYEEIAQQSGDMDMNEDIKTPSGDPIMINSTVNAGKNGYASSSDMKVKDLTRLLDIIIELDEQLGDDEEF